jgi:hypothetical protein
MWAVPSNRLGAWMEQKEEGKSPMLTLNLILLEQERAFHAVVIALGISVSRFLSL